jgi:hypothetical protein
MKLWIGKGNVLDDRRTITHEAANMLEFSLWSLHTTQENTYI